MRARETLVNVRCWSYGREARENVHRKHDAFYTC